MSTSPNYRVRAVRALAIAAACGLATAVPLGFAIVASAQPADYDETTMVTLDFQDAELAQVIETIARATNRNFIYDDRVRGRVTIVSPEAIPIEQAYAVFESVLQVKGFTTVTTPGGAIKPRPTSAVLPKRLRTSLSSGVLPNSTIAGASGNAGCRFSEYCTSTAIFLSLIQSCFWITRFCITAGEPSTSPASIRQRRRHRAVWR